MSNIPSPPSLEIHVSDNPADYEDVDGVILEEKFVLPPPPTQQDDDRIWVYLIVQSTWRFHKTDVDPWPSLLHGHHNSRPFKLDAITGRVFDIRTRKCVQRVRKWELERIQGALLASKDFAAKAAVLIGTR